MLTQQVFKTRSITTAVINKAEHYHRVMSRKQKCIFTRTDLLLDSLPTMNAYYSFQAIYVGCMGPFLK